MKSVYEQTDLQFDRNCRHWHNAFGYATAHSQRKSCISTIVKLETLSWKKSWRLFHKDGPWDLCVTFHVVPHCGKLNDSNKNAGSYVLDTQNSSPAFLFFYNRVFFSFFISLFLSFFIFLSFFFLFSLLVASSKQPSKSIKIVSRIVFEFKEKKDN